MKDVDIYRAVDATQKALYVDGNDDYNYAVGDALESMLRYFGLYNSYLDWSDK